MMATQQADACLISSNSNLLYTCGRVLNGFAYIPIEGEACFFARRPVGLQGEQIYYIRKPEQIPDILRENGITLPQVLMLEEGEISHNEWLRLNATFNPQKTIDATALLRMVRSVKTDYEITQTKLSAQLQSEIFALVPSLYRSGMTDTELAAAFEWEMRVRGAVPRMRIFGPSMEGALCTVWGGDNAAVPSPYDFSLGGAGHPAMPLGDSGIVLKTGTTAMIDCGGNFSGYMSDQTRAFSLGKIPTKAYDTHQIALDIIHHLEENIKPGVLCEDIYKDTLRIVDENKLSPFFMGYTQQAQFIGHGIGIVVNELPVLCDRNKTPIQENMILAIEPKFTLPGIGAVGLENSYIVRTNGLEKITTAPEEILPL